MKTIYFLSLLFISFPAFSQKNIVPIKSSELAGVQLPDSTRQDKRLLSTASAKTLLEMTASENQASLEGDMEVFILPPSLTDQLEEQLKGAFADAGWNWENISGQEGYAWCSKGGNQLLVYHAGGKKESSLYLSKVQRDRPDHSPDPTTQEPVPVAEPLAVEVNSSGAEPVGETIPPAEAKNTYAFTITNFDDGWVAVEETDWVRVTKGKVEVFLYYHEPIPDGVIGNRYISDYYWDEQVEPRFQTGEAYRWSEITYPPIEFLEGPAMEKITGKSCYVALNVVGNGLTILVVTPDQGTYRSNFPHPRDTEKLLNTNRFAVGQGELNGHWVQSTGDAAQYYNVNTGGYEGMAVVSSAHDFIFNPDGTYQSKHVGASGMVGNIQTYNQEYKGDYQASEWEITLTNRWKGAPETYEMYFEAVKGGRILHLVEKNGPLNYHLFRMEP